MFGAILGDMVGAPYEFDRGEKTKEFEFWNPRCQFTDDSVMTIAIADALIYAGTEATENEIKNKRSFRTNQIKRGKHMEIIFVRHVVAASMQAQGKTNDRFGIKRLHKYFIKNIPPQK